MTFPGPVPKPRAYAPAVVLAALYVAAAALERLAPSLGARFPIGLVAAGLAAGSAWRWGVRRTAPAVAGAAAAVALLVDGSLAAALAHGPSAALATVLAVGALRRVGFDGNFERPASVARFVAGAFVAGALGAAAAVLGELAPRAFRAAGLPDVASWREFAGAAWAGVVVSLVLVFPLVASARRSSLRPRAAGAAEVAAWTAAVLAGVALVFALPPAYIGIPVFAALLICVAWAGVRMNLAHSLLGAFAGTLAVTLSGAFRIGILATTPCSARCGSAGTPRCCSGSARSRCTRSWSRASARNGATGRCSRAVRSRSG